MIIALNIMLATLVIVGIFGMLAWSIVGRSVDTGTGLRPLSRRRRRPTARVQYLGRTVEHRA